MIRDNEYNPLFPVFFKLSETQVLIVGGGTVALEKLTSVLSNSPHADVTVVASRILEPGIRDLAADHQVDLVERPFEENDLDDKGLVFLCTDDRTLHEEICRLCKEKRIFVNVADTPDLCDFYMGSVVLKGNLKIAVSTNGKSPALSKKIRLYLEEALPDSIQELLSNLHQIRSKLKGDFKQKVRVLNKVTESWLADPENR